MMVGDLVEEFMTRLREFTPERYPVRNQEPRVQLDPRLWHLIHERDGGLCWLCQRTVAKGTGEIDHLVPRSSFESHEVATVADRSWNLRLACVACNQEKSNFTVMALPRTFGITNRCPECVDARGPHHVDTVLWPFMRDFEELAGHASVVPAYCGSCGYVTRVPGEEWLL